MWVLVWCVCLFCVFLFIFVDLSKKLLGFSFLFLGLRFLDFFDFFDFLDFS